MTEDRYEHLDLLIKARQDGQSWFDIIHDYITQDCQGTEEEGSCTCGLESFGGSSGTLEQCYDHMRISGRWAENVLVEDLKMLLEIVELSRDHLPCEDPLIPEDVYKRLRDAAYWHDDFNEWVASIPDDGEDEGEDFRELTIDQQEG